MNKTFFIYFIFFYGNKNMIITKTRYKRAFLCKIKRNYLKIEEPARLCNNVENGTSKLIDFSLLNNKTKFIIEVYRKSV